MRSNGRRYTLYHFTALGNVPGNVSRYDIHSLNKTTND